MEIGGNAVSVPGQCRTYKSTGGPLRDLYIHCKEIDGFVNPLHGNWQKCRLGAWTVSEIQIDWLEIAAFVHPLHGNWQKCRLSACTV
jgi:hypothetical protein